MLVVSAADCLYVDMIMESMFMTLCKLFNHFLDFLDVEVFVKIIVSDIPWCVFYISKNFVLKTLCDLNIT